MDVALRLGGERVFIWFVIFLGLLVAVGFGFLMGDNPIGTSVVLSAVVGSIAWVAFARRRWWLIVPAAAGIGGYFYFGFKIYPHEVALLGAFVPLSLAVAVRLPGTVQKRSGTFPMAMYFLTVYLGVHWIVSNLYNRAQGEMGFGNVSRAYFNALWVVLFVIAFWRYGSTKYVRIALLISYLAAFARLSVGLLTYFASAFAYIPVINYVLPGSTHARSTDLRISALTVGVFAACYFLLQKGFLRKSFQASVFICSLVSLLFGGGRSVLVLLCLVPVAIALLYRKVVPIMLSCFAIGACVGILNAAPTLLEELPYAIQRSASILLFKKADTATFGDTYSSDLWHAELRDLGYHKWTQAWNTVLFGTGIRPFDSAMYEQIAGRTTTEDILNSAAKVGAYESGWWSVIAVTGLVGFISYFLVFSYLLRHLMPILWREKVADHRHAFAFIAVYSILVWLFLGWVQGSFPSTEIMYGFIALCAFQDRAQAKRTQLVPDRVVPARTMLARRALQPAGR